MRMLAVVLLIAALPAALPAHASLRCDAELVLRGMTPPEVVERCGLPVYEFGWTDFRYPGLLVRVDEWTYEPGEHRFRRQLIFENGRLTRIETRRKPSSRAAAWR
jgi:hypothetical protein